MKFRFFAAAALLLGLSVGCQQEELNSLPEIQISNKYVSIPQAGGSVSIDITTTAEWKVDATKFPQWLTLNPMQGSAGEGKITLSAAATEETRSVDLKLLCAGKTQLLRVMQQAEIGEPEIITCKKAVDLIKAGTQGTKTYYVKGIVCALIDISVQYGNATFWMSDNGVYDEKDGQNLQVYRSTWLNGGKITTGDEIAVGDEIVVSGCLVDYKGTPETQEKTTTVVSIEKSLIKCDSLVVDGAKVEALPLDGGAFSAMLMCKGKGVSVSVPDDAKSWLSVSGIKTGDATAVVDFYAAKNDGGDRSTEVTFSTSDGSKDYTAKATVSQKGSILAVSIAEFNAAPVGDALYRISGIVTKLEQDSEKYGANLYIKDATGETYIYGTTDETGTVKTLASFGAKEGDIVEFVGKRGEHNGKPQIAKAVYQWHKSVTPITADKVAALADDDKNDPKNYVMVTGVVTDGSSIPGHKFDLATYGNFELVDESGSAYVYGVSTGWKGETKKFGTLGVKEGDKLTIIAYKTSYTDKTTSAKTDELVGMYVSHEAGGTPEPTGNIVLTFPDDNKDNNKVSAYDKTWTAKSGSQEFTIFGFNNNNWGWSSIKCGRKSNPSTASITTTISSKVSKVIVTYNSIAVDDVNYAKLIVGTSEISAELKVGAVEYVVTSPATDKTYKLEFDCKTSSQNKNGFVEIGKLEYVVE